jgi:hypothetical protein
MQKERATRSAPGHRRPAGNRFPARANRLSANSIPGEIRDVSTSGARIRLMATADLAADVPIEMLCFMAEHPDSGVQETTLVRLYAWIVWSDRAGREIGVRFMA